MRPSSVAEVAARVVAWHNRHPLARRITAAQVQGVGVVALPFVVPAPAGSARRTGEPTLFAEPAAGADAAAAPAPEVAAPAAPSLRERALAAAAAGEEAAPAPVASGEAPAPAPSPSLPVRVTAWLRALRPAARRGFSEDFIEPLTPRRIARFALRHGSLEAPASAAGPVREVLEDDGLCARGSLQTRHLRTAAIEVGSRRVRVLLGDGPDAAVIGPRLWSPARLAGSALAWVLAMSGLIAAQTISRRAVDEGPAVVSQAAAAASAAASAVPRPELGAVSAAASEPVGPHPTVHTRAESAIVLPPGADAPATAASSAVTAVAPVLAAAPVPVASAPAAQATPPVASAATAVAHASPASSAAGSPPAVAAAAPSWPVNIKPAIDVETARTAKRESAALRALGKGTPTAEEGGGPPAPAQAAAKAAKDGAPAKAASASPDGTIFALAARSTRNRAASELLLGLMKTAAMASGDKTRHTEVLPAQQGWRAIWWPFQTRQDAEKAQALLVNVGLEAELVEF